MTEPTISCPNCKTKIKLTESLAGPLLEATRKEFENRLQQKDKDIAKKEAALRTQQSTLTQARADLDAQIEKRLSEERTKIAKEESEKARTFLATELNRKEKALADMAEVLKDRDTKLATAQKAEAELIRKQRELDDAKRELELNVEKQVQKQLAGVRDKAKRDVEESLGLKVKEKEETIASMQRQIEDLKRRSEQGSQQLQGEVQELELEAILRAAFPWDVIEPVPKGEYGGDLQHHIMAASGQRCGTILWEVKRTKNWSEGWLSKLRDDQREAKADIALLVSHALPKGVETFNLIDGVWVSKPQCAIPVAIALRESLTGIAAFRQANEGQASKAELVYQYLIGPRFRHRIGAIVEKFTDMQSDLDRERKMMTRQWAKREEQIRGVLESTAGMYGDLQGIAGKSLQEIEGLDFPLLGAPKNMP